MSEIQREEIRALAFRHPWRPYQQRVLDAARLYLADRRLHVVSAPGSGKTTLGLEMFRQLGEPALVLAPTRIIRDQWIDKLRDFLPEGTPWPPKWVSRSLDDLRLFTSITYQALHTRTRAQDDEDAHDESGKPEENGRPDDDAENGSAVPDKHEIAAVIESLKRAGVRTLILDEAHHLRAEWWKALRQIVDGIDDLQVISLTATPPYDSLGPEWTRYEELCGSIRNTRSCSCRRGAGASARRSWSTRAAPRTARCCCVRGHAPFPMPCSASRGAWIAGSSQAGCAIGRTRASRIGRFTKAASVASAMSAYHIQL